MARERGIDVAALRQVVTDVTEKPWLGFIGEPRVNVLRLNLTVDQRAARRTDRLQ